MTAHRRPAARRELIGWASFVLFVAIVFRLRRALDRR